MSRTLVEGDCLMPFPKLIQTRCCSQSIFGVRVIVVGTLLNGSGWPHNEPNQRGKRTK